jgi:glutaminyl-peptide cyclotransferase
VNPRVLALACVAAAALAGCGSGDSTTSSTSSVAQESAAGFDTDAAWALIHDQVDVGQRPAGSEQLQALAEDLRAELPNGQFEPIPGEPGLRNIVGTVPGAEPAIVVGAHYDTLTKPEGFVGANNGAAGTAIVIEAAKALAAEERPAGSRQVKFVLFDGEEPAEGLPSEQSSFYHSGLRGSRAYVKAHPGETGAMVLLDYVANKDLKLPREATSTRELWAALRAAANEVGTESVFVGGTGPAIVDDHTPFLKAGVPAIDLIDWRYPGHSLADGIDKLSPESVAAVGETVVELVDDLDGP